MGCFVCLEVRKWHVMGFIDLDYEKILDSRDRNPRQTGMTLLPTDPSDIRIRQSPREQPSGHGQCLFCVF